MKTSLPVTLSVVASLYAAAAGAQAGAAAALARGEPHNWLTYSGDYAGWRYSALTQINPRTVARLAVQWVFQTGEKGTLEATPLVVDGVMYVTGPDNRAYALDARTGRVVWRYQRRLPEKVGGANRGFAALDDKLFLATADAHVVALDAKTGGVIWDVEAADHKKGYGFNVAPLVVKDKVIVGVSGGELGIRGFIDAYYAETGNRAWRFYTIPGPGEPGNETWGGDSSWQRGGTGAWLTGTYDPELNLLYWGTGNPGPDQYGEARPGDNLYSASVVALDPDLGELQWYFQFTPHDVHDWDATEVPMLVDQRGGGRPRKLLLQANRNGFFYVLDRTNGRFLLAKPFARTTWAKEIGPDGRPVVLPGTDPTSEGNYVCPGIEGATNWMSPSYSPQTGLVYIPVREQCNKYFSSRPPFRAGRVYFGSGTQEVPGDPQWGAVRAIDPVTGAIKWEFKDFSASFAGTLSTAGGLVFAGDKDGYLIALDARTGKELWHLQTGARISAGPISYAIGGKQYVAIASGGTVFSFALPESSGEPRGDH